MPEQQHSRATKICTKCQQEKPATPQHFNRRTATNNTRFRQPCKICYAIEAQSDKNRAINKKYYTTNQPAIRARRKADYYRDVEQSRQKLHQQYARNRETILEKKRRKYPQTKERDLAAHKRWYAANSKQVIASVLAYAAAHPNEERAKKQRRRARKNGAAINDFTAEQWREMKTAYGNRCVYCGKKCTRLTMDHIIPISQGGNHTMRNIVPACQSCNSKKGVGQVLQPIQPLLL